MNIKLFFNKYLLVSALFLILGGGCQNQTVTEINKEVLVIETKSPTEVTQIATPTINPTIPQTQTETPVSIPATVAPSPQPVEPTRGDVRISEKDGMEQVYVDAGEFIMGTDDLDAILTTEGGRAYPEIPIHTVNLDGFWFDKYEVTNGQYSLCVSEGVCEPPNLTRSTTRSEYYGLAEFENYPVLYISWFMARDYCQWAGRRLPTEAEWEKAARGPDGRRYPWGNEPITEDRANFCDINCPKPHANPIYDDGFTDTAPVGSFPAGASPYGALDMAGNVWEWTSTIPEPYPYDALDGREADEGFERIWKGGTWTNGIWWIRASVRYRSVPTYWYGNLGFRCASSE